jgi:hypothetical protein
MTIIAFPSTEPPFPHLLAPLGGESLLSFMVRLDRANGWEIGETAKMLAVHTTGWRGASGAMWASGTIWDLRRLAHLSQNPYEAIEGLTLLPDLRRAANDPQLGIGALGDPGALRFCPVCLAATGAIPRFCLLPLLEVCPVHQVRMVRFCPAHRTQPYPPEIEDRTVRCTGCRRDLGPADGFRVDEEALSHLRDTWRAWTFLLGWQSDDVRSRGYRTIRSVVRGYPLRNLGPTPSFERLVTVFLALHIEPALLATLEDRPIPPCPNAACPRFIPPSEHDPLLRGRVVERHCAECGARFIGRRILLCFDQEHGASQPSPRSVRKARRRLRRWHEALVEACRQDLLDGRRITVTGAFRRAGVPMNANLRAFRLGLVALVRDAARRQRLLDGSEPRPFRPLSMAEYRVIVDRARGGRWDEIADCARSGRIYPNQPTPPIHYDSSEQRHDPRYGVLDPLFSPAWVARRGEGAQEIRGQVEEVALGHDWPSNPLSDRWTERVDAGLRGHPIGPVVRPSFYGRSISPHSTAPNVIAFVCGEWSPEWMPEQLFYRPAPPADPFD